MESLIELPLFLYSAARSAQFALQFDLLNTLGSKVLGAADRRPTKKPKLKLTPQTDQRLRSDLFELLRRDSHNIASGVYPASVLKPEPAWSHLARIPQIMADGIAIYARRYRGQTTKFTRAASELLEDLPRYYRRNFHFQTDGYLSDRSASLYEHQVEMLFRGAADAMRRLILPPLKNHFASNPEGKGLRILEVAAGTGRTTSFVKQAFPKAKIVALDLSEAYLMQARKQLQGSPQVGFIQGDGASLPFDDKRFDAVYSVFLFHELPMDARKNVVAEAKRVLRPGGFFGLVDSIQKGEKPELDPLLERFPIEYHEPFYRDYSTHPMEALVRSAGFKRTRTDSGFFSKVVSATR